MKTMITPHKLNAEELREWHRLQAIEAAAKTLRTGPAYSGSWTSVNTNDYENLMAALEGNDK